MADSTLPVLAALKALMVADTGVSALVAGRVYTDVPQPPVFPYVSFGPILTDPWDASCVDGNEVFPQIDVWSRKPGPAECLEIMGAINAAIHFQPITLTGHDHVLMSVDSSRHLRDRDNETHHGVIRLRILTQSQ